MATVIGRNSFARHDIIRERAENTTGGCDWCGQVKMLRSGPALFRYGTEPDAIRTQQHWMKGKFCSYDCCKIYHS